MNAPTAHGYSLYTRGCRCDTCKAAKADYVRDRRAQARALVNHVGAGTYLLDDNNITHGTRAAYEERGCRCEPCIAVKRAQWRREDETRKRRRVQ